MKVMRFYYHFAWFCPDFEGFSIISEGCRWIWAGRAMEMQDFQKKSKKMRKKSKNFSEIFFSKKKIYVIFWFPVKIGLKFFFSQGVLFPIFRPVLAQKNTYAFSARGRRDGKCRKSKKKIKKIFKKNFKKKIMSFFDSRWKLGWKIFFLLGFCSWFFDLFWPKKILMHFQRGAGGDGKLSKKWEKNRKNFQKFFLKKNLCHFLIPGENWSEKFFSCLDFDSDFSACFGPKNT